MELVVDALILCVGSMMVGALKRRLNTRLDNWENCSPAHVSMKLSSYQFVSFDIFDTLVKRSVPEPTAVFSLVGERLGLNDFRTRRIIAEQKARLASTENEISLEDVYSHIELPISIQRSAAMQEEIAAEMDVCFASPLLLQAFRDCMDGQKNIFLLSDMYLPKDAIENLLSRLGISGYKKLYLSSAENATKTARGNASLFQLMFAEQGIDPADVIHVGNSFRGDYLPARRNGCKAIKIATHLK